MKKYVVVSTVRNEETYIEKTLESMVYQTELPLKWVIVNDGSSDRTPEIIEKYENQFDWIVKLDLKDRGHYFPGEGIVKAFYEGFELVKDLPWDYVVKMDCDLSFDAQYYQSIIEEFALNPKLGIAGGGIYNVVSEDKIVQEKGKADHPWGASIVYDRKCFEKIGGLQATLGWELASILKAQIHGWETRCFTEKILYHYRLTGNRHGGFSKGRFRHGRNLYRFGYPFYYTVLKGGHRLLEEPVIIGGIAIIAGHISAAIKGESFLYDSAMRKHLKKRLKKMLLKK